jgi:hypothetical protein
MAPTITTQNHTLVQNAEVSFGTIFNATGFDFIDVFVDGSGNPNADEAVAEWRLYEIVGDLSVLVATAPGGGRTPSVLDWGVGATPTPQPRGASPAPFSPAEGAGFTFELRAFFSNPFGTLPPNFSASLIGYNEFDTAPNAVSPAASAVLPTDFSEVTFATLAGYAQYADAVVSQSFDVPVRFALYAQAGAGGVIAEVASVTLQSSDGIARIFGSPVRLPGATAYMLRARFDSNLLQSAPSVPVSVSAGLATHSSSITVSTSGFSANTLVGNNADVPAASFTTAGWWLVRMINLAANRTVNLPAAPLNGEVVVVKDGDESLAAFNIIVNGNGNTIDGAATYTMTLAQNGAKGSVTLQFDSTLPNPGWFII